MSHSNGLEEGLLSHTSNDISPPDNDTAALLPRSSSSSPAMSDASSSSSASSHDQQKQQQQQQPSQHHKAMPASLTSKPAAADGRVSPSFSKQLMPEPSGSSNEYVRRIRGQGWIGSVLPGQRALA